MKINNWLLATALMIGSSTVATSCSDDDNNSVAYNDMIILDEESQSLSLDQETLTADIEFKARTNWTAQVKNPADASWLSMSPSSGKGGVNRVKISARSNNTGAVRTGVIVITSNGTETEITVSQDASEIIVLNPDDIADYDKFFHNSEHGGDKILQSDSKFSFTRMKQSEHFFVFWDAYFGDDPNGADVAVGDRVDVDDLLAKAEHFFDTNINKLGMATLGQGKSTLDNYKMQIYILDPTPEWWVATGSGYDDMIGSLWITPSTCQPVGSTIAHEIGHSFQYQTYADRVQTQGATNDKTSGFRYGFVGPDGSGNGGCVYWEQCAQWQAHCDYPEEQFTGYDYPVWLANCHRHFHHEWQRYASYWLQSYWVEKRGVNAYGRIWTNSVAPEDAIMAYTRLYNGGDYQATREELIDYAMRMATYDIAGVREYAAGYQNLYSPNFIRDDAGFYQVAYSSCPGATGFNVIALAVPAAGGKVSVNFHGLDYGAPLHADDTSSMVDGDGKVVGKPVAYNAVGGAENMGWRYGFVAMKGNTRTYGQVGKAKDGTLEFDVPAGTEQLYLVVQGSPEVYMSHGWDEIESNDPQFPYTVSFTGTDLLGYAPALKAVYDAPAGDTLNGSLMVNIPAADGEWVYDRYDINDQKVLDFFGVDASKLADIIMQPVVGTKVVAEEGKIAVFNEEADGTLSDMPTANVGYWLDKRGNAVKWGAGQVVYYEINGSVIDLGKLGAEAGAAGEEIVMRPVFVYTKNGATKTLKFTITYKFV